MALYGTPSVPTLIREAAARLAADKAVYDDWDTAYVEAWKNVLTFHVTTNLVAVGIRDGLTDRARSVAELALTAAVDVALTPDRYPNAHIFTIDPANLQVKLVCDCGNHP